MERAPLPSSPAAPPAATDDRAMLDASHPKRQPMHNETNFVVKKSARYTYAMVELIGVGSTYDRLQ
eukprot:scaffold166332_cov27-Tisochrysis_lutea.AAC.2